MRSRSTLAAALAAIAIAAPIASAQAASTQPSTTLADEPAVGNAFCPVMPEEAIDPNFIAMYEGRTVYLCCKRCLAKFDADPGAYIANLPPLALPAAYDSDVSSAAQSHGSQVEESDHGHNDQHNGAAPDDPAGNDAPLAPESQSEHDHTDHAEGAGSLTKTLSYLGRFHVVAIHFPIALLIVGALFELASIARPFGSAPQMVRASVGFGALSALIAAGLGLMNAIGADYTGILSDVFWWHRLLGLVTAGLAVVAWIAVERRARRPTPISSRTARSAVFATALLVGAVGHLGGSLVFGWDYLAP